MKRNQTCFKFYHALSYILPWSFYPFNRSKSKKITLDHHFPIVFLWFSRKTQGLNCPRGYAVPGGGGIFFIHACHLHNFSGSFNIFSGVNLPFTFYLRHQSNWYLFFFGWDWQCHVLWTFSWHSTPWKIFQDSPSSVKKLKHPTPPHQEREASER